MTTRACKNAPDLAILALDFAPDVGGMQSCLYEIGRRLAMAYKMSVVTPVFGRLPEAADCPRAKSL